MRTTNTAVVDPFTVGRIRCGGFQLSLNRHAPLPKKIKARGASLVERHASDVTKAKKATGGKNGGKKNFSWSREEDFEQRRKFTPQVRNLRSASLYVPANGW